PEKRLPDAMSVRECDTDSKALKSVDRHIWSVGSVGRTNCSKCPTGLVGRKYESMVAWLSR
ncbi:MAG: hypothetical protein ILP14_10765, partial [Oscillospiraceae bacterium]|nr:hypothetical protein [Oscillospiraceae bacterium]